MSFLTTLALRRRSVTVLLILMVLTGGLFTYTNLQVELFPEIEFPLLIVTTFYPSANPDAVVSDVTESIENAVAGLKGIDGVQTVSSENLSLVLATFVFGTDMEEAEATLSAKMSGLSFPEAVGDPRVARINPEQFPVMQFSVLSDMDVADLQEVVEKQILPVILSVDGVLDVEVSGTVDRQVFVTISPDALAEHGISLLQVAGSLQDNNVTLPAGSITEEGQTFPVRTTHTYGSLEDLNSLVVGFAGARGAEPVSSRPSPVTLSDVATVELGAGPASSLSRTNGQPSIGIGVLKSAEANTVKVTEEIKQRLAEITGLPPGVEIIALLDDGPEIQAEIDTLQDEGFYGFLFAMAVVFLFLFTVRPSILRGLTLTLRPTLVIGLSIPLSIFTGILLMGAYGMSLNFMTLGGLAISVGRVVDDSIVVLENFYRHMRVGEDRFKTALVATREVAPAITASTLTTIVVFLPLAFIKGLVGSFFLPFALTVSFALVASLIVALTAVPVVGAILLRRGDMPDVDGEDGQSELTETWMQRAYLPVLLWSLRHKAATLLIAVASTVAGLALVLVIPITLFPSGGERFLTIDMTLPPGTSIETTMSEAEEIEAKLAELVGIGQIDAYLTTIGTPEGGFSPNGSAAQGGNSSANVLVRLTEFAPEDITKNLRETFSPDESRHVAVTEIRNGPPASGLEIAVTGSDYGDISDATSALVAELAGMDGMVNVISDVAESRDEVVIRVDTNAAAAVGLSARAVAFQVNQFMVGRRVTQLHLNDSSLDVVLRGRPEDADRIDKIRDLEISGPMGSARLADIAKVALEQGPVSISRFDGRRSANIKGTITAEDTQSMARLVQQRIDSMDLPDGVEVSAGGIFADVEEGFRDIGLAMAVGVVLVYLVMAASLGALRNPFVIVMSLPLAVIGALAALALTGRTLGLPAMMGFLLLVGIVVTNAIVLIAFVEQLRERGLGLHDALIQAGTVRLRPILMTGFTTSFALFPLAAFATKSGGIIGAELATVVIGGLVSSMVLTLVVVPVVYTLMHQSIPDMASRIFRRGLHSAETDPVPAGD